MNQVCLIRTSLKICSVGVRPGTGLENSGIRSASHYLKRETLKITLFNKNHAKFMLVQLIMHIPILE